ncbi:MAG: hypothetical protein WCD76_19290 [Pyrinomonadaceae bacterium]
MLTSSAIGGVMDTGIAPQPPPVTGGNGVQGTSTTNQTTNQNATSIGLAIEMALVIQSLLPRL